MRDVRERQIGSRPEGSAAGRELRPAGYHAVSPMSPREQRFIHNTALLREVNAHIADLEARVDDPSELLPLFCECARTGCLAPIELDRGTFEAVREKPRRFLVVPGHEQPELESVIERHVGYLIVEKHTD